MIKIIDLFCGAGGLTTGASQVPGVEVIACVNHDDVAISSHKANHPDVLHFVEDVRHVPMIHHLKRLVQEHRKADPSCVILIWSSLECTNFSKAKGGLPRDADSRTLAECLFTYIELIRPDGLWIENVEEFMAWGPLDENGKPLSRRNGSDYMKWCNKVQGFGYKFDYKILNAADYGAYTSRRRYFAQFMSPSLPITWPQPTHAKKMCDDMFGKLQKWNAVKDVLDFSNKGESIFTRKKPLVENTLKRIYAGLVKYVAGGDDSFLKKYYSGRPEGKVIATDGPAGTIKTIDGHALVQAGFIAQYNGGGTEQRVFDIDRPLTSVSTNGRHALIQPAFIYKYHKTGENLVDVKGPASTVTTKDRMASVWIDKQYGSDKNHQSIDSPAGTVMANDKHCLMQAFIVKNFSQGGQHNSTEGPVGALVTVPKENLVQCENWVMATNFNNVGRSIYQPSPTVMASRKHQYLCKAERWLLNPQYESKGGSVEDPAFTLIARMDKMPPYLVQIESTKEIAILIFPEDSETMQKIKLFMATYGISDIYMRMLTIPELKAIQGFPKDYVLNGTQTEQKKHLGNAVEVSMGRALIRAQSESLHVKMMATA